jgi:hypothetical protein
MLTQRNAHKPKRLQSVLPTQYRSSQQQDSSEFARYLFDALETDLKETPLRDLVNAQFGGRILSTITCSHCGSMSSREVERKLKSNILSCLTKSLKETFLDLTLAFPPSSNNGEGNDTQLLLNLLYSGFLFLFVRAECRSVDCSFPSN